MGKPKRIAVARATIRVGGVRVFRVAEGEIIMWPRQQQRTVYGSPPNVRVVWGKVPPEHRPISVGAMAVPEALEFQPGAGCPACLRQGAFANPLPLPAEIEPEIRRLSGLLCERHISIAARLGFIPLARGISLQRRRRIDGFAQAEIVDRLAGRE